MARDHALALSVSCRDTPPDGAVLRLYRWASPTLSLGRNEPARRRFDPEAAARAGVDVVRRPTGGRAVLHHRELTYAVVTPVRALGGVRESYLSVNRGLLRGLASLGVAAEIAPRAPGPAPGPGAGPCFGGPAPGEVIAGGRKLVGSAQARMGRALLQHGSILVGDDQGLLDALVLEGRGGEPGPRPATLGALLDGRVPSWDVLGDAVVAGLEEELGGSWTGRPPAPDPTEETRLGTTYASEEWTWRR